VVIHDPPLVFHFDPRRAVPEVVNADVAAFIGQCEGGVRVRYHDNIVRIHPRGALPKDNVARRIGLEECAEVTLGSPPYPRPGRLAPRE
jgi:hypothetical protein